MRMDDAIIYAALRIYHLDLYAGSKRQGKGKAEIRQGDST